jgi:hypothetical protein
MHELLAQIHHRPAGTIQKSRRFGLIPRTRGLGKADLRSSQLFDE